MRSTQWLQLLLLSVLWGGSFFFVGVAVKELPPLTLVLLRVGLAAAILVPLALALGHRLPSELAAWSPFLVMAILNNIIPFVAIVTGQREIASGLASVLNATTPLFTVVLTHLLTDDKMSWNKLVGVLIGIAGVAILMGPAAFGGNRTSLVGMALILVGTCSYGFAGVWGRRLRQTPVLVSAACQLACSSLLLAPLALVVDRPWQLAPPSLAGAAAVVCLALLSTALAYVVFFRILTVAGPANAMLVTLLIPLSGIWLGVSFLDEPLLGRHIGGAVVIALSLLVIDGRVLRTVWR